MPRCCAREHKVEYCTGREYIALLVVDAHHILVRVVENVDIRGVELYLAIAALREVSEVDNLRLATRGHREHYVAGVDIVVTQGWR